MSLALPILIAAPFLMAALFCAVAACISTLFDSAPVAAYIPPDDDEDWLRAMARPADTGGGSC